jgi:hypothetical protein
MMKATGAYYGKTLNGFVPGIVIYRGMTMGRQSIIYRNRLESYVMDLFINQRKTIKEIAQLIQKKKKIPISREAVRVFISRTQSEG